MKKYGFVMVFLLGACLVLYPIVSQIWSFFTQTKVITNYQEIVYQMTDDELIGLKSQANLYNEQLSLQEDVVGVSYLDLLSIGEAMGYIEIEKINVYLPIYHGVDDKVLEQGVGHMEKSSLPVGGEGTHAVLTGHTGLPKAKLFTDLEKLEVGDVFKIYVLDEVLVYQVNQIKVVLPEDTSDLNIVDGKDYTTLVTCTPYGVNTHRLLVRGIRIEEVSEFEEDVIDYQETDDVLIIEPQRENLKFIFVSMVLIVIILGLMSWRRR